MDEALTAMRLSERTFHVAKARSEIRMAVDRLQSEYDITDIELLQALTEIQSSVLKYMLRAERHPGDPDKAADVD